MSRLLNALFAIVGNKRNLSAAITVAKFTCIKKFEEVLLIFSEYQSTLLPIILSGDRLQLVMLGPVKNESQQKLKFFKSTRKSIRVHES